MEDRGIQLFFVKIKKWQPWCQGLNENKFGEQIIYCTRKCIYLGKFTKIECECWIHTKNKSEMEEVKGKVLKVRKLSS